MAKKGNDKKPTDEDLRTQLTELNNRARAYASQLRQVPFAYLALAAILLTQSESRQVGAVPLLISVVGAAVLVHMFFVVRFHNRTVRRIGDFEEAMGLKTVKAKRSCEEGTVASPGGTVAPFMSLVFLGVLVPLIVCLRSFMVCLVVLACVVLVLFGVVAYRVCNRL